MKSRPILGHQSGDHVFNTFLPVLFCACNFRADKDNGLSVNQTGEYYRGALADEKRGE